MHISIDIRAGQVNIQGSFRDSSCSPDSKTDLLVVTMEERMALVVPEVKDSLGKNRSKTSSAISENKPGATLSCMRRKSRIKLVQDDTRERDQTIKSANLICASGRLYSLRV